MTAIRCERLGKHFHGVRALSDVSFEADGDGCLGIMGPNGSGKSTLLALLSGVLAPDAGNVFIDGLRLTGSGPAAFRRAGVARCFQYPSLIADLRVWENIAVGAPARESYRARRSRAIEVAEALELTDVLDAWPDEVSLIAQRRVEIARAVIGKPAVILLDEPAAGLTEQEGEELVDVILERCAGALKVVVEHNLHVIDRVADRILVLIEGQLMEDGPAARVRNSDVVREAYLGVA